MYSLFIKTATLVNKAELDVITTPELGFNIANVLELYVEPAPIKISVKIIKFFLFLKFFFPILFIIYFQRF